MVETPAGQQPDAPRRPEQHRPGPLLRASLTLAELYGPGLVFNGYLHPRFCRWLTLDPLTRPGYGASALSIAGEMPMLCYRASVCPETLALLRDAGLDIRAEIHVFHDHRSYLGQLRRLSASGRRFVHQYVQPADEVDPATYWVDRALVARLNNKCALSRLVPPSSLPRRALLPPAAITGESCPCVVKACTDEPSGLGTDVRMCERAADLESARHFFRDCEQVVVEEWLDIANNLCLNYAVLGPSDVRYLGVAEQVSDARGGFHGNWIAPQVEASAEARIVGEAIARSAAREGYRGIAGVDLAVLADGTVRVYDLNFRLNNCTRAILLREAIAVRFGATVLQAVSMRMTRPFGELLSVVRDALDRAHLLPLWILNAAAAGHPAGTENRLKGIILGHSRAEVEERRSRLAAEGLAVM